MRRRTFKSLRLGLVVISCLFILSAKRGLAASPTENEVKAVLLFHLTQFVTWPTNASQSPDFLIGILGPDPFGDSLDAVMKGEKVGTRAIRIVRSNRARELIDCSLVYVSPQAREPLSQIFNVLKELPTLTVGENDDFIDDGGMIRFKPNDRKIRLQVQLPRARSQGFNISAQLLRVSDVVQGDAK